MEELNNIGKQFLSGVPVKIINFNVKSSSSVKSSTKCDLFILGNSQKLGLGLSGAFNESDSLARAQHSLSAKD